MRKGNISTLKGEAAVIDDSHNKLQAQEFFIKHCTAMSQDSLHLTYAEAMFNHPYGYALYELESSKVIKPGACGYFNHEGLWNPVADLTDSTSLARKGFTAVDNMEAAPPLETMWGPKTSEGVEGKLVNIEAGAS